MSLLILLYGCINFKKGLILFFVYQLFWYSTLVFQVSVLSLNTSILLTVVFCFLYILNKKSYKQCKYLFPFRLPFILVISSYLITCFFAISGFGTEFTRSLNYILKDYILIWLMWNVLEDEKDFEYLFKCITLVILFGCVYGLVEYFTKTNPILNFKILLSSGTIAVYDSSGLRGYRLTSYFEHPIGAGMVFALYSTFTLYLWISKKSLPLKNISLLTALLCIPCLMLTKMRSAMLFFIITLFIFFNRQIFCKKKTWYLILMILFLSPVIVYISKDSIKILLNLFTTNKSMEIGGSSLSMRINQLTAILNIMKTSPIFGLGETFRNYLIRSSYTDAALGYEGLWFEQAVMHGIYGIITKIILIYYTVFKIPKKFKVKEVSVISAAYWLVYTFSSIPSFRTFYLWIVIFYFIKNSNVYKFGKKEIHGKL